MGNKSPASDDGRILGGATKSPFVFVFVLVLQTAFCASTFAQAEAIPAAAPEAEEQAQLWNMAELDILLGPIALYPDPLLAVLLPAATQPVDIVMAVRYLDRGGDPALIEAQPWDANVKALANYPDVIRWMDENLEWTTQVGHAFLLQPEDVMDTIQRLRRYANTYGNLQTTPQQIVEVDDDGIDILPADPEVFYVPVYEPRYVYTRPAISGGRQFVTLGPRMSVGTWMAHDWDWRNRRVVMWTRENCRPRAWWSQPRKERFGATTHFREWCPQPRGGQAPCKFWAARHKSQSGRSVGTAPKTNPLPQKVSAPARPSGAGSGRRSL